MGQIVCKDVALFRVQSETLIVGSEASDYRPTKTRYDRMYDLILF